MSRRFWPGASADGFTLAGLLAAAAALAPVLALGMIALGGDGALWRHLFASVMAAALLDSLALLAGVIAFVVIVGTGAAWLVAMHDFPGRRWVEVALLLPLAFPAYVLAYAWLDLMHPIGPAQNALRALLGYAHPSEFRLPDLRNLPGAIFVFGFALYPYVYVAARTVFLSQMTAMTDAARLLGHGSGGVFFRVALPLARPAIASGAALAAMEALNDVGAAEFLAVQTLTTAVYSTWVNRNDLPGAAQIALAMLVFLLSLLLVERLARGGRSYAVIGRNARLVQPKRLHGLRRLAAPLLLSLPVLLGFAIPAAHLLRQAWQRLAFAGLPADILAETGNTLLAAALATLVAVSLALLVVSASRLHLRSRLREALLRLATIGYAIPGTVLAIGFLAILGDLDAGLRHIAAWLGLAAPGLFFSASLFAVVAAYTVRFFRLATSKLEAGLERLSPSLDQSARTLGRTRWQVLRVIYLPLLSPALAGAALLVFIDAMKELPATLLLRPMNFETLATHLYGEAARGTYENGALAACLIVGFGLLPVILLTRLSRHRPLLPAAAAARAAGEGAAA